MTVNESLPPQKWCWQNLGVKAKKIPVDKR